MLFAVFEGVSDEWPVLLEDLESFGRLAASALPIEASMQSAICRSAWTKCSCSLTTPAPCPSLPRPRASLRVRSGSSSPANRVIRPPQPCAHSPAQLSQLSATGRIGEAIGQRSAFLSAGVPTMSTRTRHLQEPLSLFVVRLSFLFFCFSFFQCGPRRRGGPGRGGGGR